MRILDTSVQHAYGKVGNLRLEGERRTLPGTVRGTVDGVNLKCKSSTSEL